MSRAAEEILKSINDVLDILGNVLSDGKTGLERINDISLDENLNEVRIYEQEEEHDIPNFEPEILSVLSSLENVRKLRYVDKEYALKKIRFELIPLVENMRMDFHYYTWVYPDDKRRAAYPDEELREYFRNPYLEEAKKTGKYKYDLSIFVTGYNKLEYTKLCVESLMLHLPQVPTYEIIFLNHGSSDGTKEYFESKKPDKQLDIAVNGGGAVALYRIVEGKYVLQISNDIIVTKNSIDNMYKCITSDNKIAWVVPATPHVSNHQSIPAEYNDIHGMLAFAEKNNICDERRWEERVRLCNPMDMRVAENMFKYVYGRDCASLKGPFPDDKTSMFFRRAGYKLILAKDAYCYHFGSVTLKDELKNNEKKTYAKGRIDFIKKYGMDPWGYGFGYDDKLFEKLKIDKTGEVSILGINSGLCSNILKIKDLLKERVNNRDVWMTSVSFYKMNEKDMREICDETIIADDWSLFRGESKRKYDYILVENDVDIKCIENLKNIFGWKKEDGILLLRVEEKEMLNNISKYYYYKIISEGSDGIWVKI